VAQVLLLVLALVATACGLQLDMGRRCAARGAACVVLAGLTPLAPVRAAEGTKSDKKFQECVSKCVYEETKITKGIAKVEVVSRTEAYAICKPKCATSKEQLLLGQPKK